MAYRLRLDEPVPDALRAVAVDQLRSALHSLRDDRADHPVEAVHDARKSLKKTRSLLRLARPGLPKTTYRAENDHLRDIARSLSSTRDADVLGEVVDGLAERAVGQLPEAAFAAVRRELERAADTSLDAGVIDRAVADLEAVIHRAQTWPLERCDRDTLTAGIARAYTRGLANRQVAEADRSVEALHEWRKRVKDLWYHHRLLRDAWPGPFKAFATECSELADLLGDDHDLAMLAQRVGELDDPAVSNADVLGLIAARRAELQTHAVRVGQRVYAETPKAFRSRIDAVIR